MSDDEPASTPGGVDDAGTGRDADDADGPGGDADDDPRAADSRADEGPYPEERPRRDDPRPDDDTAAEPRHDRVTVHPTPGPGNSFGGWWRRARNPLRVAVNYAVIWLVRLSPSLVLKRWLLRRLGATVGPGVAFGLEATVDVFWPELVTVREDAIVGYDATLLCHEFLQDEYRTGEVVVGERAMIGAGAVVLPGVEVGADAQVAANSLVTRDVPPGATVAGVPATVMGSEIGDEGSDDPADEAVEPGQNAGAER